jgi:signal transduction histidine kinase
MAEEYIRSFRVCLFEMRGATLSRATSFHFDRSNVLCDNAVLSERGRELEDKLRSMDGTDSKERVDALNDLAWEIGFSDVHRTADLAREATEIARRIEYPRGIAWGLLNGAYRDYFVADYDIALEKAREALALFEELGDAEGRANVLGGLGLVYWSVGDLEGAIASLHEGTEFFRESGNEEREAWGLTSLGGVYESIGDLDKGKECHLRALELFRSLDHELGVSRALTGLGAILKRQGKLRDALEHHLQALELSVKTANRISESRALNDIGIIHRELGNLDDAERAFEKALALRRETGNRPAEVTSLLDTGQLHLEKGNTSDALAYLDSALALSIETKTRPKQYRAHELLSRAHEATSDFEKALHHHREFQRLKEEVIGEESATRIKNFQIRLESESLEQLKSAQAQLIQSEKMAALGKLVAGVAHEVNTPVGVIRSSLDIARRLIAKLEGIAENRELVKALSEQGDAIAAATERLSKIVDSLRRFTRLDESRFQLADVHEGIEATLALLTPQWGERIRIVKEFGALPKIQSYPTELNQAFMTLLLNAAEAIDGEGTITIRTSRDDGHVLISTSDTGRGIPTEQQEQIFDIGFVRHGSRVRLHVGLANVQAVVEKHRGCIDVSSEPGRGTTFEIRLPVRQRAERSASSR